MLFLLFFGKICIFNFSKNLTGYIVYSVYYDLIQAEINTNILYPRVGFELYLLEYQMILNH